MYIIRYIIINRMYNGRYIAACLMKPHGCRRNFCCLFGELRLGVRFDLLDIVPSVVNGLDGKIFQLETMVFHGFLSMIVHFGVWIVFFWCLKRATIWFFPHGGIREIFPGRMWPLPDVSRRSGVPSYIGTSQIPAPLRTFWWPPGVVLLSGNVLLKGWFSRLSRACFELVRSIFPPKEQKITRNSPTLSRLKPPRRLCPKIISHSYGEIVIVYHCHQISWPFPCFFQVPRCSQTSGAPPHTGPRPVCLPPRAEPVGDSPQPRRPCYESGVGRLPSTQNWQFSESNFWFLGWMLIEFHHLMGNVQSVMSSAKSMGSLGKPLSWKGKSSNWSAWFCTWKSNYRHK